jgi:lambda family phage portal protein
MAVAPTAQMALPLAGGPVLPSPRARSRRAPSVRNSTAYEAGAQTRRTLPWRPPTSSPNTQLLQSLGTLRDRSRHACRNDGWAKGTLDKLVTNIIGTGMKPLSKAVDPEFRRAVQALWFLWTDESDADGLLDFYGQQAQVVRAWLEAGEVFVRLRPRLASDGLTVPLQVQVLEPELCPYTHNTTLPSGNKVRAGIEFDRIGRRVAYWFHPSRPGDDQDFDPSQLRRVPAAFVIHLFEPLRPGQIRGLPHLTQALIKLHELDKFEDATLLRSQIANLFAGFIKRPSVESDVHPLTGLAADATSSDGRPILSLEPGIFQELEPGEEVEFNSPPQADPFGPAFMKQQLMSVSAATGVPYEVLTGDMSGLNDRVMRVVLHEFRRQIQARQHHIVAYQLCRPVWMAWLDRVQLSGALPIPGAYLDDPTPWSAVRWMPQGWPYIHPVQDVAAAREAIKSGFTTRSAVVSEQGEDAEVIDAEQAQDNERAEELGLSYESATMQDDAPQTNAAAQTAPIVNTTIAVPKRDPVCLVFEHDREGNIMKATERGV